MMRYSLIAVGVLSLIAWAAGLFPGTDSAPSVLLDLGPNPQQRAAAAAIDSLAKDFWSKNGPVQIVEHKKDQFKKWALEDGSPWSVVEAYEMWLEEERKVDREAGPGGWMVARDPRQLVVGATWAGEAENAKADTLEFNLPGGATLKSISRQAEDVSTRIDSIWVIHKYADGSECKQGYSAEELEAQ